MGIKGEDAIQQEVVFKKGTLYSVDPTILTLLFVVPGWYGPYRSGKWI